MGGKALHDLGFIYVIFPAVLSSLLHVALAVIMNNISSSPARQFPAYWRFWGAAAPAQEGPKGYFRRFLGKGTAAPPPPALSHVAWAMVGSFIGIFALFTFEQTSREVASNLGHIPLVLLIGSFGAQAVLIFGAPGAPFSQPWNAIGGNAISSTIGVLCWKLVGAPLDSNFGLVLSSALAVSLSIGAMLLAKCVHPPAGATALIFTMAGKAVHDLGFIYVIFPATLSSILHVIMAVLMNNIPSDPARQYPHYWNVWQLRLPSLRRASETKARAGTLEISSSFLPDARKVESVESFLPDSPAAGA
jgi:CBS-domain-containing membrane protein